MSFSVFAMIVSRVVILSKSYGHKGTPRKNTMHEKKAIHIESKSVTNGCPNEEGVKIAQFYLSLAKKTWKFHPKNVTRSHP